MPSSYTSLLGLVLPVQGELQGTWGDTVNNELTALLDTAIAGTTTLNTDADVTLTDTDGVANQARQQIILWTATGTTTRNITAPAQSKTYVVINATGGTQSIVIRGAGPTTGVTVAAGRKALVAWNGSDFVEIAPDLSPYATLNGTQTLTNKTIEAGSFTNGYTEEVYALGTSGSIALNPANGSIQTCALTGNPTFTDSLAAGQSIVLMLTNGGSYTVTWPTMTWVTATGDNAPTLTGSNTLVFWKVSTTLYGAYVGSGV